MKTHVYQAKKSDKPAPVLINFHGSGFVLPLHGSDDFYCRHIASNTDYIVLDVPYRLAPEHPFPAAVEDAEDAICYVLAHSETYDTSRIVVSGFSAGGCLALVLASGSGGNIDKGIVKKCAAFYPVVDLAEPPSQTKAPQEGGKPIPAWMADSFNDAYAPGPSTVREDPRISPFFAAPEDFCDEVFVVNCGYDTLAPKGELLVEKLKKVPGKRVKGMFLDHVNHAWNMQPEKEVDGVAKRDRAFSVVVGMLNGAAV